MKLAERIQPIKVLLSDVDGVLTSGEIFVDRHGVEVKTQNRWEQLMERYYQ